MELMSNIIDFEPSSFQEASDQQVWKDSMVEEYNSIMKNDVLDIVPIPEGKLMVTSKWLYKIKHADDGSIKKYKVRWRESSPRKSEWIMRRCLLHLLSTLP